MRNKILFPIITILITLFLSPSIVAGQVGWIWEGYSVESWAEVDDSVNDYYEDYDYGTSPPLFSSALIENGLDQMAYGESSIYEVPTSYEMHVHTEVDNFLPPGSYSYAEAYAIFSGGFIPIGNILELSYSYSYDIYAEANDPGAYAYNEIWAYLEVWEVDSGGGFTAAYSEYPYYEEELVYDFVEAYDSEAYSSSDSWANIISIPVTPGVEYEVYLDIYEYAEAGDGNAVAGARSLALTYDFTVVPEPVSSILFITGAATLGAGFYRKKRKNV